MQKLFFLSIILVLILSGCIDSQELAWSENVDLMGEYPVGRLFEQYLGECKASIWQDSTSAFFGSNYFKIKWIESEKCIVIFSYADFENKYNSNGKTFVPANEYVCRLPREIYKNPKSFDILDPPMKYCRVFEKTITPYA
jgi:hypothetical protein